MENPPDSFEIGSIPGPRSLGSGENAYPIQSQPSHPGRQCTNPIFTASIVPAALFKMRYNLRCSTFHPRDTLFATPNSRTFQMNWSDRAISPIRSPT